MNHYYDDDEWEVVVGTDGGSSWVGKRRRDPVEVLKIKAERLKKEEDAILLRAAEIMKARALRNMTDE